MSFEVIAEVDGLNILIAAWAIIGMLGIIAGFIYLLKHKKILFRPREHYSGKMESKISHTGYVAPEYQMRPSSVEYYGIYSPTKAGAPDEPKKSREAEKRRDYLPRCPECGGAIGYAEERCPHCGLTLASKKW